MAQTAQAMLSLVSLFTNRLISHLFMPRFLLFSAQAGSMLVIHNSRRRRHKSPPSMPVEPPAVQGETLPLPVCTLFRDIIYSIFPSRHTPNLHCVCSRGSSVGIGSVLQVVISHLLFVSHPTRPTPLLCIGSLPLLLRCSFRAELQLEYGCHSNDLFS